jgi:hypothetical protein
MFTVAHYAKQETNKQAANRANRAVKHGAANTSTLKMEAMFSSETSVNFHRTKRRYNSEDITTNSIMIKMKVSSVGLKTSFADIQWLGTNLC